MCDLSLDFPSFRPSVLDGARSKVDLRGEGYTWAPILWSSDNSKRYGSFPTWFILWLRAILWMEICWGLNGRVISLKIFEPSGENLYCVAVNSADHRVSLFT